MVKKEKIEKVEEIKKLFKESRGLLFINHTGLKVKDTVELRQRLSGVDSYLKVVKNTLALRASREVFEDINLEEMFEGPTSIVVSKGDVVAAARAVKELTKEYETLRIKGGIIENRLAGTEVIDVISSLPGREVLLTNLAVSMKLPIYMLVNVLSNIIRSLVFVLSAIKLEKEKVSS
ncbi:MAG: 50S ribosomal protein L10 [Actinobacteria bacterium]|nr:50S ribosomal protein L10 [Actinomycetota bacterium]